MGRFRFLKSLSIFIFSAFIGLAVTPNLVFAQHGGGSGGHAGGGGGGYHGGGGGGFHSEGGSYGGSHSYGGGREYEGGGYRGGPSGAPHGMAGRPGGSMGRGNGVESGRGSGSEGNRLSGGIRSSNRESANIRPAISDGQWHSFGGGSGVAHGGQARDSVRPSNSNLMARSVGRQGAWSSLGGAHGFVGTSSRVNPGYGWYGGVYHGGYGWGGYGWGCCRGWGWGGLGFAFGWPYWGAYWGPAWGLGWSPWWYDPYWYGPAYGPYAYGAWPGYADYWDDNPPPYRPDADNGSQSGNSVGGDDSPAGYLSPNYPVLNYDDQSNPGSGTT